MAIKLQPVRSPAKTLAAALVLSAAAHLALLWPAMHAREAVRASGTSLAALQVQLEARRSPEHDEVEAVFAPSLRPGTDRRAPVAARARSVPANPLRAMPAGTNRQAGDLFPADTPDAPDADSLRRYRWALALAAQALHPHAAGFSTTAGATVDVRVEYDAGGMARAIIVRESSGDAAIDGSARTLIARAVDRVALPQALRGRAFAVDVSIDVRAGD